MLHDRQEGTGDPVTVPLPHPTPAGLSRRSDVETATPFSFHFYFVEGGIETIIWQNGVNFLLVNLEKGANRAPVSRIWACIIQLLPRRVCDIFILFPFITCSRPQSLLGVSVYSKTSSLLGVYVSSVMFGGAGPQRAAATSLDLAQIVRPIVTILIIFINFPKLT